MSIYTHFDADFIWSCGFKHDRLTDDAQIFISIIDFSHELQILLYNHLLTLPFGCLTVTSNLLCLKACFFHSHLISVNSNSILPVAQARSQNLDIILELSLPQPLSDILANPRNFYLQNMPRIRPVTTSTVATQVCLHFAQIIVNILIGLPAYLLACPSFQLILSWFPLPK